jgi:DNA-directed RNA polymerase subunit RPC12/RpoP
MPTQNISPEENEKIFDSCPHCGQKLSPWQQVLLSVDRALTCKNCWYRIVLDVFDDGKKSSGDKEEKTKS